MKQSTKEKLLMATALLIILSGLILEAHWGSHGYIGIGG